MAAVDGLVQIALLDVGRQTGARAAALHIIIMSGISAMDAQPIASVLSEMPGPALPVTARYPEKEKPSAMRDGAELVFGLHEHAAVFRQLAPQDFHDRRPRRDRITGAVTHAGGDESVGQRGVAIHGDLVARARFLFELAQIDTDW